MATHHDKPETEEQPTVKKLRIDEDAASVESATTPEDKAESIEVSAGESSAEEKDPEVEAITGSSRSGLTPQAMGGTTPKAAATPTPTPTPTGSSTPASSGFGGFSSFASSGFAAFAKPAASTEASSTSSGFAAFDKPASCASSSSSGFGSSSGFSGFAMKADASAGFGAFAKSADDTADGFGEVATADFDPNAEDASVEFTPVVTLTEAEIANGEEEERIIVEKRAKLFKLVGTDYVEVGIGPFRVLKPKDAHDIDQARASARMVMRRESHPHGPGTKLILNARLTVCVSCVKKSEKSLMVVVVEAPGSSESENDQPTDAAKTLKPVTYLLRFASSDDLLLVQDRVVDLLPAHASTS